MELERIHKLFFLGIGGIGMSALARYFVQRGAEVYGYDRHYSKITNDLEEEGVKIIYKDDPNLLKDTFDIIVWTPAIKPENSLYQHFSKSGQLLKKRSEVLGWVTQQSKCIAVAGTHGKTSVSSLIAHLLTHTGKGCTAFLGGITTNYNSNFIYNEHSDLTVVEADEFDRSFLRLNPFISIITSTDADHLDIYSNKEDIQTTFSEFARRTHPDGKFYYKKGIALDLPEGIECYSYSIEESADYFSTNIISDEGESVFNFNFQKQRIENFRLQFPGLHNVENATVALAVALHLGCSAEELKKALYDFQGIERRFQFKIKSNQLVYIDDYAHHPEEIRASITSARQLFRGKKLTIIFQPHLFSRTRDFAPEFARSLSLADEIILLPIYPAREEPIEGVNSEMLLRLIDIKNKKLVKKETLSQPDFFKNQHLQVVMTLGAGDIGEMVPDLTHNLALLYPDE